MASESQIDIYRGEAVTLNFEMVTVAVDITGWSIRFTVSKAVDKEEKLMQKDASIIDATHFRVLLAEEDTDIKQGTYVFDAWRVDEGQEQVLSIGPFVITGDARVPPIEP